MRTTDGRGGPRPDYLDTNYAEKKASEYLAGARTAGELAGRSLALLAMARWADEDAVAQSNRTYYALRLDRYGDRGGVPWATEAEELLDELLLDHLPEPATARICAARDQAAAEREAALERRAPEPPTHPNPTSETEAAPAADAVAA